MTRPMTHQKVAIELTPASFTAHNLAQVGGLYRHASGSSFGTWLVLHLEAYVHAIFSLLPSASSPVFRPMSVKLIGATGCFAHFRPVADHFNVHAHVGHWHIVFKLGTKSRPRECNPLQAHIQLILLPINWPFRSHRLWPISVPVVHSSPDHRLILRSKRCGGLFSLVLYFRLGC